MSKTRVFHGTTVENAINIIRNGVKPLSAGYFGQAFYVTDDPALAFHNYAWGKQGAVLSFDMETRGFLDTRRPEDAARWSKHMEGKDIGDPYLDNACRRAGINGLFDDAIGGFAVYNQKILTLIGPLPENITQPRPKTPKNLYVGGEFIDRDGFYIAEPNSEKSLYITGHERFKDLRAGVERWLSQHTIRYIVRGEQDNLIGMIRITKSDKKHVLSNIWVDKNHRGQGVAKTMETLAMIDFPKLELDEHLTLDGSRYFKTETAQSLQI